MKINQALRNAGHQELLEIQKACIDAYNAHNNIMLLSQTGSGKTLAFLLSILGDLENNSNQVQGVIISPTRELCQQIDTVFKSLKSDFKSTLCYGGHSIKDEVNSINEGTDLIIATPGRLLDLLQRRHLNLNRSHVLCIDEFDKCLELGFEKELKGISSYFKSLKKRILISATSTDYIPDFLQFKSPHVLDFLEEQQPQNLTAYSIPYSGDIKMKLAETLASFKNEKSIVFCNYREVTDDLCNYLNDHKLVSIAYHGGQDQEERNRAVIKFKNGSANILVCTDLASRGLDIPEVMHVIHYQYPSSIEAFTHRQGRTARMSAEGSSYIFTNDETQLPEYIDLPENKYTPTKNTPPTLPEWETLYFGGGKKEKINKIDLVGFLSKKGRLRPNEIGLITVLDHSSYVAISRCKARKTVGIVRKEKIKGKRVKIALSR